MGRHSFSCRHLKRSFLHSERRKNNTNNSSSCLKHNKEFDEGPSNNNNNNSIVVISDEELIEELTEGYPYECLGVGFTEEERCVIKFTIASKIMNSVNNII